ncbi:hypothetical protein IIJ84_003985 [Salmonella enterica subsp. enterica serovar Oranienburg]|nr:hypothetical protein [Salmonella enterica subsp. enterica serovar Oranienburg]
MMMHLRNALASGGLFFLRLNDGLISWRWLTLLAIAAIYAPWLTPFKRKRKASTACYVG